MARSRLDAPVHFSINGDGVLELASWDFETQSLSNIVAAQTPSLRDGTHVVELLLFPSEDRVAVVVDGRKYINVVDADYFDNLASYATWGVVKASGAVEPAELLSIWADGETVNVPIATRRMCWPPIWVCRCG